ncbi:hypothetical protein GCM10010988_31120 [Cnuibacter physcomitrellae]|nr:hypothetical protein GCM10010988_31120 [Cnuibacter physcomitrellae]
MVASATMNLDSWIVTMKDAMGAPLRTLYEGAAQSTHGATGIVVD